jgi:hypothetical protein
MPQLYVSIDGRNVLPPIRGDPHRRQVPSSISSFSHIPSHPSFPCMDHPSHQCRRTRSEALGRSVVFSHPSPPPTRPQLQELESGNAGLVTKPRPVIIVEGGCLAPGTSRSKLRLSSLASALELNYGKQPPMHINLGFFLSRRTHMQPKKADLPPISHEFPRSVIPFPIPIQSLHLRFHRIDNVETKTPALSRVEKTNKRSRRKHGASQPDDRREQHAIFRNLPSS